MIFQTMPKDQMRRLLEKAENTLGPEFKKFTEDASRQTCPYCESPNPILELDPKQPFKPGENIFNYSAKCGTCGSVFSLWTRIAVTGPRPRSVG